MDNKTKKRLGIIGALSLSCLIMLNFAYAIKDKYLSSPEDSLVKENVVPSQEQQLDRVVENLLEEGRDKFAFCIQASQINLEGAIGNPLFFGQLPADMQNLIAIIKDHYKDNGILEYYLKRDIKNIDKLEKQFQYAIPRVSSVKEDVVVSKNQQVGKSIEDILEEERDRLAFCIQSSYISPKGAIQYPNFFKQLPDYMKNLIGIIKDHGQDNGVLESYLKRDIKNINKLENEFQHAIYYSWMMENPKLKSYFIEKSKQK